MLLLSSGVIRRTLFRRAFSEGKPIDPHRLTDVTFSELSSHLKRIQETPDVGKVDRVVLIDVRGQKEIEKSGGSIPTALNLPIDRLADGLMEMDPERFKREFKFAKPNQAKDTLLFYCRYNTRSRIAASISKALGYRALIYPGGWEEWRQSTNKD